jgi:FSR family fosmidomycin resistance protein-like MFS transporter
MTLHGTRSLFLVALGHLAIELCSQFLPVLYPVLIVTLGLSYTQVGIIALVAGLGTSLVQPLFGYLSDLWNPRLITVLSVAWIGLVMGLVGFAGGYASLTLLVGLGVLGSAAFHPAAVTIASACGGTRRGVATSVFSVGGTLGTALSPLWIAVGLERLGMRGTLLLIPVALLVSLVLQWQLSRFVCPREGQPVAGRSPLRGRALASLILIVLAVMFLAWVQISFRTYLPTWVESQGGSLAAAGQLMFAFSIALGVGSLAGGALSDRLGRWQLFALCLALLGPVEWLFLSASGPLQAVWVGVMGVLIGATFPMSIVLAQETWPSGVGIASGLVMGLGWVPGGIGASITGLVADRVSLAAGMRSLAWPALLGAVCVLAYAAVQRRPVRFSET